MKTWLISDTHLNHAKIKTHCQRPDDFTEQINDNIHRIVGAQDILIHLGDIGMDKVESWSGIVHAWPGLKWLIKGNHDKKGSQWYVDHGLFHMACDALLYRGIWLTHRPYKQELPPGARLNVHGHLHNVWDRFGKNDPERSNEEFKIVFEQQRLLSPLHRLFAVEYTGYAPVEFDKFVNKGHKLYQSTGPNEETKKRLRLQQENEQKCSSCITQKIECQQCFDEEGSYACIRPAHKKSFNPDDYAIGKEFV